MKKVYTLLVALLLTATLWAQSPEKINYQAVIRDANSALVTNQAVGMQISILQRESLVPFVYVETQTPTTNANGLVSLEIGSGTVLSGDFTTIDWSTGSYFITTETDPTGASIYTISDTSQLLTVPYALHAKIAENYNETDPLFSASPFIALTQEDIDNWTGELDELDSVFLLSAAGGITTIDTAYWNSKLDEVIETDPVFLASFANAISETDTAYWNSKLDEVIETDPIFLAHPSSDITEDNIENWKNVYDSYNANEREYLSNNSLAGKITGEDIINWDENRDSFTELDSIFLDSYAYYITAQDIVNLNNLSDTNRGDHDASLYLTKDHLSDSLNVFRDSIAKVHSALKDSAGIVRGELTDSIDKVYIELDSLITEELYTNLNDTIKYFREKDLSDSIAKIHIELGSSIGNLREALNDSVGDFRDKFNSSLTVGFRKALNDSIASVRDEISDASGSGSLSVGMAYGGGVIFWLDDSGAHGLIAATSDISISAQWGDVSTETEATLDAIYAGISNTDTIVAYYGPNAGYAAHLCADYSLTRDGEYYDDWYLPSEAELLLLDGEGGNLGNDALANEIYWSSTEHDTGNAKALQSGAGASSNTKSTLSFVRAIRAF